MAFKNFSSRADSCPLPFKYAPVEEVKRFEAYRPGGYHPLIIGEVLQSRYRIVHVKLWSLFYYLALPGQLF